MNNLPTLFVPLRCLVLEGFALHRSRGFVLEKGEHIKNHVFV